MQHLLARALLRSWPFPNGAGRAIDLLREHLTFKDKIAEIMTRDGFKMTVPLGELIGQHLYLRGEFDRAVVEVLLRLAKPENVLLDIGANIGYVSGCFLQQVPRSTVFAVEPVPQNLELLRINLKQFVDRYSIFPFALSSADAEGWMDVWSNNMAASRLAASQTSRSIPVAVRSAASFLCHINHVDLIKIDIEGHEFEVLSAARDQLKRLQPRAIVFEHEGRDALPGGRLYELLGGLGYRVLAIRKRLTGYDLAPPNESSAINYVALVA